MRGTGRIFKRPNSSFWWIAYSHRGKEKRESTKDAIAAAAATKKDTNAWLEKLSDDDARKIAEKLLRKRLQEIGADSLGLKAFVGPQQDRILVSELLDALEADLRLRQVRTLDKIQSQMKRVRKAFGDCRAIDISTETVDRYIESRLSEKDSPRPATVNRETGLLAQAFRLAVERQRISAAPKIRKLSEKGNARQGFFEKADFQEMVKHLPEYLKGYVEFAYYSGWRRGEVRSLTWTDVDLMGKVIRLRPENSKTAEGRILALEGELWNVVVRQWALREYQKADKTTGISLYVFHRNGLPIGDIRKSWDAACKEAKVEGKLFHDLRRTAIRNMVRAGVPERVAMSISGHKTRAIFDRYNIVSEADLRSAMERTQTYLNAAPSKQAVANFPEGKPAKEEAVS